MAVVALAAVAASMAAAVFGQTDSETTSTERRTSLKGVFTLCIYVCVFFYFILSLPPPSAAALSQFCLLLAPLTRPTRAQAQAHTHTL